MDIKDIMTKDVITVTEEATVTDVARLLTEHKISGLPVVDENSHVVGMVTEGDLIYRDKEIHAPAFTEILGGVIFFENPQRFLNDIKKMTAIKVADIMTKPAYTVKETATIQEAATLMVKKQMNRLPVVASDDRLVGIVSRQDLVRSML